jgi:uncharacterized membrane protein
MGAMTRYELYLLGHILAAVLWIGGGFMLLLSGARARSANDEEGMRRAISTTAALGTTYFIPASLAVLVFGLLMVFDGPWSFDQLWIILGLLGYAATFLTGLLILKPSSERIDRLVSEAGGTLTPAAQAEAERLLTLGRIDYIVLFLVVADMVLKPTIEDVGTLLVMAAVLGAGVVWVLARARSIGAAETA